MVTTIPFLDLSLVNRNWSLTAYVSRCRHLLFSCIKQELWDTALLETASGGQEFELKLSRSHAAKAKSKNFVDDDARYALFSQAFRAMRTLGGKAYRLRPVSSFGFSNNL